ncbi:MAG: hypothetical protein K2J01_01870 [Clostridiales bacterium]|nr:hypothetical protein [Clostridiales bacterium]
MRPNVNILCANEFALAIALTVFILLTVILSVLLIFLAASKNFRAVFFREKSSRKKKSAKKQPSAVSEPAPVMPHGGVDTIPIDPPKAARRTGTRKTAEDDVPEFLNAIPTVPLGGFPQAAPTPRGGKGRQSSMRMTDISDYPEQGGTYVARSVTITRARPVTPTKPDNKSVKDNKTEKTDKATTSTARTPKRDKK